MLSNENPRVSQNALGRVGVESHAELRGHVATGVTVFGATAIFAHASQDATALPDLRMVQTLFQAVNISPRGRAALRRTRRYIAGSWFVCRGQTAHRATLARSGVQKIVRISAARRRTCVAIAHSARVRRRNRLECRWFAGGNYNELAR